MVGNIPQVFGKKYRLTFARYHLSVRGRSAAVTINSVSTKPGRYTTHRTNSYAAARSDGAPISCVISCTSRSVSKNSALRSP
jgi:hypothetical protein